MLYDVGLGIGSRTFEVSVNTTHLVESTIKNTLNDNNIRKIVIIAHSKGNFLRFFLSFSSIFFVEKVIFSEFSLFF